MFFFFFFFSSRRRHTRFDCDWSSDVCSSDLIDYRCTKACLEGGQSDIDDGAVDESHAGTENRRGEYPRSGLFCTGSSGACREEYAFIARWSHGSYRRLAWSYLSSALRSQLPSVAAASYVLWQNSSNEAVGDSAFRTSSYIRRNSPSCRS